MMEALDLLKKDWEKGTSKFQQYNESDLYQMIRKKSTSIVKWIFFISVIELLLWIGISVYMKNTSMIEEFKTFDKINYLTYSEIISYIIIVVFIYLFYKNYKKINNSNSVKDLIFSILKTRKTVQNYVKIIIIYTIISSIVVLFIQLNYDAKIIEMSKEMTENGTNTLFYVIYVGVTFLFLSLMIGLIWLFYRIIYGILLKRLSKNYEELKKIDL
jgi:hypothetical protein